MMGLYLGGNIKRMYCGGNIKEAYVGSTRVFSSIPTPIYELGATYFENSTKSDVINTHYKLLKPNGSTDSEALGEWTLFVNVGENTKKTSEMSRLMYVLGGWSGTTNFCMLVGGAYSGSTKTMAYWFVNGFKALSSDKSGKFAFRRSSALPYIQYSLDGKIWNNTAILTSNIVEYGSSGSIANYLAIGGALRSDGSISTASGAGWVYSTKLWDIALDDISTLFKEAT